MGVVGVSETELGEERVPASTFVLGSVVELRFAQQVSRAAQASWISSRLSTLDL